MRIALAAEGSRGDIHPLLGLGQALERAGHRVLLCAPPDFAEDAAERGIDFHPVGASVRDYLTAHAQAIDGRARSILGEASRYARESLTRQFSELPPALDGVDLVVGGGVQAAAATAAERLGVPYRYVVYCPALLPSREYPPMVVPRQSLPRWLNRTLWRLFLPAMASVFRRGLNQERAALGLPPVRDVWRHLLGERPVLAVDPSLATQPPDCPFEVQQLACLHPFRPEPLPPKLESFLAQGLPPVYFGFGSMPAADPAATTRAVLDAVDALGCRAIVSRGWAGLGDGPLPDGVLAIGPVSHPALFPRVAAVVHHGGAGTTTTAARAGVPQVLVPHVFDQFYWARQIERHGVGPPPVLRRRLDAAGLAEALASILDNEFVADRARELGERLRAEANLDAAASALVAG